MSLIAPLRLALTALAMATTHSLMTGNGLPLLFMDKLDASEPYGRIRAKAASASMMPDLVPPPLNYSAGDTIFGAFENGGGTFEVWAAVGRPGEPLLTTPLTTASPRAAKSKGVTIYRYTTTDFKSWDEPIAALFLANGSGKRRRRRLLDGSIWTVKSIDRSGAAGDPKAPGSTYLLAASYGSEAHTFIAKDGVLEADSFVPSDKSLKTPNFKDHDDVNLIYARAGAVSDQWADMQIMYETYDKRYCDNVKGARRVVSVRNSTDGTTFSNDWGCLDKPQKSEHCSTFNTTAMVRPNDAARIAQGRPADEDPPELEFYRIRAFYLPGTKRGPDDPGRLVAHALMYVPSPTAAIMSPDYGRQPLWYCKGGCCHGPHMYEEVSRARST